MANFFEQFGPAPAAAEAPAGGDNFFARFGPAPPPVDVAGSIAGGQIVRAPDSPPLGPSPQGGGQQTVIPGGEGMTFPTAPGPSATARRMGEGAAYGFGDRPLGINPEDRAKYPIARAVQPLAAPADFLLRALGAGAFGAAGAAAGVTEDLGASPSSADRLQRDLGIMAQFPGEPGVSPGAVPPRVGPARVESLAPGVPFRPEAPRPVAPSLATERADTGVRLLPPEIPHAYTAPRASREDAALGADAAAMRDSLTGDLSARRSAGAAGTPGTGPLAEISPAAQEKLKAVFEEEGFTPATLEQRLEEMSSHEYLGEISPNTALHMSALNGTGGAARNEITNSVRQRSREAGERMESAFDRAFGAYENRHQLQRSMEISRDQQVQPFWQRFREMTVEPSPAINALMPRLEAAGALQAANRALAVEGLPSRMGFQKLGTGTYIRDTPQFVSALPAVREEVPTAAAFQAAKEHLDDLIERSMGLEGGANDARRYTALKNDLINALDRHPDPEVAGVWRRARDEYATPTSIIKAMKTGERALTGNISAEELPFLTASYSPAELRAFNVGIRGRIEDLVGRPGRTENAVINTILARSNQSKIRWAIGDEKANELIAAIEHEQRLHNAPNSLIYNSMTQPRQEAAKFWTPQPGMFATMTPSDLPRGVLHGIGMGVNAGARAVQARMAAKAAAEATKVREEVSRVLTLQGPERDAVARALVGEPEPHAAGGRVKRAKGGKITKAPSKPPVTGARKAPDGHWYVRDRTRPGKYLRVVT